LLSFVLSRGQSAQTKTIMQKVNRDVEIILAALVPSEIIPKSQ
jgi:hypothetical protein